MGGEVERHNVRTAGTVVVFPALHSFPGISLALGLYKNIAERDFKTAFERKIRRRKKKKKRRI